MRKITIGYSTHIIAPDAVLRGLASLLILATDEKGEPVEFRLEATPDPATLAAQEAANKLAHEELERQGKSWLDQYERANRAEAALKELRTAHAA